MSVSEPEQNAEIPSDVVDLRHTRWRRAMARLDKIAAETERHDAHWLKRVKLIKLAVQMVIATAMMVVLFTKASLRILDFANWAPSDLDHLSSTLLHMPTLTVVGRSLAYSAGAELAYMLFTPGPDEAIDPVIVGLAASILIIISDDKVDSSDSVVVPVACLAIGFLLFLKRHFSVELGGVTTAGGRRS